MDSFAMSFSHGLQYGVTLKSYVRISKTLPHSEDKPWKLVCTLPYNCHFQPWIEVQAAAGLPAEPADRADSRSTSDGMISPSGAPLPAERARKTRVIVNTYTRARVNGRRRDRVAIELRIVAGGRGSDGEDAHARKERAEPLEVLDVARVDHVTSRRSRGHHDGVDDAGTAAGPRRGDGRKGLAS